MPLYVATALAGFIFFYAIEKLFMRSIGFSDAGIGLLLTVIGITMLFAGIPSGIIADKWSRKGILMIAYVFLALTCLIGGLSYSPFMYVLAAVSWGLFFALQEGVHSSIIYDTVLEESGNSDDFAKYYGRSQIAISVGLIASSLIGTIVVQFTSLRQLYFLSIPITLSAVLILAFFREPTLHQQHNSSTSSRFKDVGIFLRQRGVVGWMIASLFLIVVIERAVFEFYQLWLIALVIPVVLYGVIAAATQSSIGLGGVIAPVLLKSKRRIWSFLIAAVVASAATLVKVPYIAIPGLVFLLIMAFAIAAVMQQYLHGTLESHIRASGLSVAGTLGEIGFFVVAPLMGYVSQRYTAFAMGWVLLALSILIAVCVGRVLSAKEAQYQK